jgi:hypothetical protein
MSTRGCGGPPFRTCAQSGPQGHASGDSGVRLCVAKSLDKAANRKAKGCLQSISAPMPQTMQSRRRSSNDIYAIAGAGPLRCVVDRFEPPFSARLRPGQQPSSGRVSSPVPARTAAGFGWVRPGTPGSGWELPGSGPDSRNAPARIHAIDCCAPAAALVWQLKLSRASMTWIALSPFGRTAMISSDTAAFRGPPPSGFRPPSSLLTCPFAPPQHLTWAFTVNQSPRK